jgi:hypothetical protein
MFLQRRPLNIVCLAIATLNIETVDDVLFLFRFKELGFVWEVDEEPSANESDATCSYSFQNKDLTVRADRVE